MEIVNENCALLSNCEVLQLLKEIQYKKLKLKDNRNLATINYESIKYLEDSPAFGQTSDNVTHFLLAIKDKFRLTKAEKLQILNQRPNTLVELQLLIEESEERFSEEAMQQLLDLIRISLSSHQSIDTEMANQNASDSDEHSN